MIVSSANVGMTSERSYSSYLLKRSSILMGVGIGGGLSGGKDAGNVSDTWDGKEAAEETEAKKESLQEKLQEMSSHAKVKRPSHLKSSRDALSTIRETCMQYLLKIFFGESERWDYAELFAEVKSNSIASAQSVTEVLYYRQEMYYEEREDTSFSAEGTVKCADGREIRFRLGVEMSRSFSAYYEENYVQIRERMCDPLVINLEGNTAELTDQRFFFDIDGDGAGDEISALGKGSGYLALDKNGDGVINDGNELFGAKSGNGFADLAAYDSDGNGWIDEADDIWEKLCIWVKDENGDKCYKLAEKNVGAICLTSVSTDFSLYGGGNKVNGMIRRTGFFLYENGGAGSMQHLDVTCHEKGGYREAGSGRLDVVG